MTPEELLEARKTLGYTQKALAASLEVSRATYQRWEAGLWPIPKMAAGWLFCALNHGHKRKQLKEDK